jgi:hypothetical protein
VTRADIVVVLIRVIFGVIAAVAALLLLFGAFIFDNPAASGNPLAWNLALAPLVYIALYAYSLVPGAPFLSFASLERGRVVRALLPSLGILWYGVALLLLQVYCHGNFGCEAQ